MAVIVVAGLGGAVVGRGAAAAGRPDTPASSATAEPSRTSLLMCCLQSLRLSVVITDSRHWSEECRPLALHVKDGVGRLWTTSHAISPCSAPALLPRQARSPGVRTSSRT